MLSRFFTLLIVLSCLDSAAHAQRNSSIQAQQHQPFAIPLTDFMWTRSSDGSKIAYLHGGKGLSVLDLQTLKAIHFADILTFRENEEVTLMLAPFWSPYDPDELIFKVHSLIDTSDEFPAISVQNIYRYNLRTKFIESVTPPGNWEFGPYALAWFGWRYTSTTGSDTLRIGLPAALSPDGQKFQGYYIPQTHAFVRRPGDNRVWSPKEEHFFESRDYYDGQNTVRVWPPTVDSILLNFPFPNIDTFGFGGIEGVGFSPNAELVLFEVDLLDDQGMEVRHVLISRCDDPANPFLVLDPKKEFGMSSRGGMIAVFLTDSSIALSMHEDGATVSPLWEVSIEGKLVRQLTRVQQGKVDPAALAVVEVSATINPFSTSTEIDYTLGTTAQVELSLYNALGQVVWSTPFGAVQDARTHRLSIGAELQAGSYFLRVATMTGEVKTVKLIKQ